MLLGEEWETPLNRAFTPAPGLGGATSDRGVQTEHGGSGVSAAPLPPTLSQRAAQGNKEDAPPGAGGQGAAPSLVGNRRNSAEEEELRLSTQEGEQLSFSDEHPNWQECPNGAWIRGTCTHQHTRYLRTSCKSRWCPVCGPAGRHRIAERIAYGIREFWPAAWLTLTFESDVDKKTATRRLASFKKWLKSRQPPGMEYAATYERQPHNNDRLHINLICAPWEEIPQPELEKRWGARLWVEWVKDDLSVATETTKSKKNPEALGHYLGKLEQAVPEGRRVSYSRGWPKLPKPQPYRMGVIKWERLDYDDFDIRYLDSPHLRYDYYDQVEESEWEPRGQAGCACFEPMGSRPKRMFCPSEAQHGPSVGGT